MTHLARRAWQALEPCHAMVYFAPEPRVAFDLLGFKGYWMGYFASRSAAMGPVPAAVVTATFYSFHPGMVARAIPTAWSIASPAQVLKARAETAGSALRHLLAEAATSPEMEEAAALLRDAAAAMSPLGRPLFAGHAALGWPSEPHRALWHGATLLREHRGDGHVATLMTHGIDGCEANVLLVATGRAARATVQPRRGWSDDEWAAATSRLTERGLLDKAGQLTGEGVRLHQDVEDRTDELAMAPWRHLGAERADRLLTLAEGFGRRIVVAGGVPADNPTGLPVSPGAARRGPGRW
jgi:hypothetical protein